jgi:hypothetical protein
MLALEWGLAVTSRFSVIWEPTRLPFVGACPQRYTVEPTLSGRSICFVGVSKQQVAPIPTEGHLSALNDAGIFKEKRTRKRTRKWYKTSGPEISFGSKQTVFGVGAAPNAPGCSTLLARPRAIPLMK